MKNFIFLSLGVTKWEGASRDPSFRVEWHETSCRIHANHTTLLCVRSTNTPGLFISLLMEESKAWGRIRTVLLYIQPRVILA